MALAFLALSLLWLEALGRRGDWRQARRIALLAMPILTSLSLMSRPSGHGMLSSSVCMSRPSVRLDIYAFIIPWDSCALLVRLPHSWCRTGHNQGGDPTNTTGSCAPTCLGHAMESLPSLWS